MVNSTFDFSDFSAYMSVRIETPDPTRVICTLLSASVKIGKAWNTVWLENYIVSITH